MIPSSVFQETLLGFLEPVRAFMADPAVTEIIINGPDQVYVERHGRLEPTSARFKSRDALSCALRNAAQFAGKLIDEQNPVLEARLPDGSRLEAVLPPAAVGGPHVAIRRFSERALSLQHLLETGSLSAAAAATLEACVRARLNILIAGGTGTGKTSLLNLLTQYISGGERVIVIGEMRGGEALDVVQAMVSGHGGCLGTVHATYPRDTLTRLETLSLMANVDLPLAALRLQIGSGLNLVVQMARALDGRREITHITEVRGFDLSAGRYELHDLFERRYADAQGEEGPSSQLVPTGELPAFLPQLRRHGVDLPAAVHAAAQQEKSYATAAE